MAWQFILTDLQGTTIGEVGGASARKVTLPHMRVPSASFTVPLTSRYADTILTQDCLVRAYRTDPNTGVRTLGFHGPVIGAEESGAEQSVAVTCAGPFWRLTKRLIPGSKLKSGWSYPGGTTPVDLGHIARQALIDVNGEQFTGIQLGSHVYSTTGWVAGWSLKNAAEAIAELSSGISSFEFQVRPVEPESHANPQGWPIIGYLDIAPTIGENKPDVIFEYGTPRANVDDYSRSVSRDSILTQAVLSVSGWPNSVEKIPGTGDPGTDKYNLVQTNDPAAVNSRGLFEEVVSDAGILDDGLRTELGQYHVNIRKNPKQVVTLKPALNAKHAPLTDYVPGDTVRGRAVVNGSLRFDVLFRIWGVTFDIDQNGNESVDLELVAP